VTEAELRAAPTEYPPEIAALYLQVPEGLPGRVRDLAAQIVAGVDNPYDRAVRLQDYLRANYVYTLDVPPPAEGRDAVDYFLFEAPGGFCSYYASALAVMLRTQGVAARVATGYAMGEYDRARRAYRVPASAAHAWVEVYFPGYGWVEFEPTSAQATFYRAAGEGPAVAPTSAPPVDEGIAPVPAPWRVGVAAMLVVGLGVASWLLTRRKGLRPLTDRARALRLYGRMRQALRRAGVKDVPGLTPDEFQQESGTQLGERPGVTEALAQATALHERAAYSSHTVSGREVNAAEGAWRRARRNWPRLWLR
jgi:hypothetical protein